MIKRKKNKKRRKERRKEGKKKKWAFKLIEKLANDKTTDTLIDGGGRMDEWKRNKKR